MLFFRTAWVLAATLCALSASSMVHAQGVYRIVGPDGKVTFSDRAPSNGDTAPARAASAPAEAGNATGALPYGLRQVVSRFPVTLYTSKDCAPCASARNLLLKRGIPFTERTVTSNEDIAALERLSGSSSLPFGSIGGQQLQGFSDTEWAQYLDAAGYPQQSQLPRGYQRPAAAPLVAVQPAAPEATQKPAEAQPERPQAPTAPSGPTPSNPAGIRF